MAVSVVSLVGAIDLRACVFVSLLAVAALLWLERRCSTQHSHPLRWRHAGSVGKTLCLLYSALNVGAVAYVLPKLVAWGHFTSLHHASCAALDAPEASVMFAVYLLSKVRRTWAHARV